MRTLTLASIYELQGLKEEAIEIYREVLRRDPQNHEARIAVRRLSGARRRFGTVNEEMKRFFIEMDSDVEFNEFERWLSKPWN